MTYEGAVTMTQSHTPTPWKVTGNLLATIESPDGQHDIAWVSHAQAMPGEANASFIVRACNTHDALVAALRDLIALHDYKKQFAVGLNQHILHMWPAAQREQARKAIEQARAALAAADKEWSKHT